MTEKIKENYTILVAEDDADDYDLLSEVIDTLPHKIKVFHVKDGEEVLDYLYLKGTYKLSEMAPRPDLIILDLNMPKRHGAEVLGIIKKDKKLQKIPVVVFTTSSDEGEIQTCYEKGANSYIIKPMNYDNFVEALHSIEQYWFDKVQLP